MKISVFQIHPQKLLKKREITSLANKVLKGEGKIQNSQINIILTTNDEIKKLNRQYFNNDRVTDVIAFPFEDEDVFGELYICVDQAIERSSEFNATSKEELSRLIIHGLLHLSGYVDSSQEKETIMHEKEDYYLNRH